MNELCTWCKNAATLFNGRLAFPLCSLVRFLFTTKSNGPQGRRPALHSSPRLDGPGGGGGGGWHLCSTSTGIGALSFSPHPCISSFPLTSLLVYAAFFLLFSIQWQEQILILGNETQTNKHETKFFFLLLFLQEHRLNVGTCNVTLFLLSINMSILFLHAHPWSAPCGSYCSASHSLSIMLNRSFVSPAGEA